MGLDSILKTLVKTQNSYYIFGSYGAFGKLINLAKYVAPLPRAAGFLDARL